MSALFSLLNLTEDAIVTKYGTLVPGGSKNGIALNEFDLDAVASTGLSILSNDLRLGLVGPASWGLPSNWTANTEYYSDFPASAVYYNSSTYICKEAHVSTNTFDPSKFQIVATGIKGADGEQGIQGVRGLKGDVPWSTLTLWSANTVYTNVPPASAVKQGNAIYICTTAHTSTNFFDASKWQLAVEGSAGPQGNVGPTPWDTPVNWSSGAAYTNTAPASVVVFDRETYVCKTAHTSTGTFDAAKFIKVTFKGLDGTNGGQGIPGPMGQTPWGTPTIWAVGVEYTNVAPASFVVYQGSGYVCKIAHTSTATFDSSKFSLVVSKGDPGESIAYATSAETRAGTTATKAITPKSASDAQNYVALTDAAPIVFDVSTGFNFILNLTDVVGITRTLQAPTGLTGIDGRSGFIHIKNSSTGGRKLVFDPVYRVIGNSVISLSSNPLAEDRLSYSVKNGVVYLKLLDADDYPPTDPAALLQIQSAMYLFNSQNYV